MYEFVVIAGAIFVAQLALVAAMFAIVCNKHFIKWYCKEFFKMMKSIEKNFEELDEEEWES